MSEKLGPALKNLVKHIEQLWKVLFIKIIEHLNNSFEMVISTDLVKATWH